MTHTCSLFLNNTLRVGMLWLALHGPVKHKHNKCKSSIFSANLYSWIAYTSCSHKVMEIRIAKEARRSIITIMST